MLRSTSRRFKPLVTDKFPMSRNLLILRESKCSHVVISSLAPLKTPKEMRPISVTLARWWPVLQKNAMITLRADVAGTEGSTWKPLPNSILTSSTSTHPTLKSNLKVDLSVTKTNRLRPFKTTILK